MSLTLSEAELFELTGYKQTSKQIQVLRSRGVDPIRKPDNTLAVMREWVVIIGNNQKIEHRRPQLKEIRK